MTDTNFKVVHIGGSHKFSLALRQFNRPVSIIKELFPAMVPSLIQLKMNCRVALRLYRSGDEFHMSLFGCSPTFFDVTAGTGTDDILPCGPTSHAPWGYMVQR